MKKIKFAIPFLTVLFVLSVISGSFWAIMLFAYYIAMAFHLPNSTELEIIFPILVTFFILSLIVAVVSHIFRKKLTVLARSYFCTQCGTQLRIVNEQIAVSSGKPVKKRIGYCDFCRIRYTNISDTQIVPRRQINNHICPRCNSEAVFFSSENEVQSTSPILWLLLIFLIPTIIGAIILIVIILSENKVRVSYGTCQSCGFSWRIQ